MNISDYEKYRTLDELLDFVTKKYNCKNRTEAKAQALKLMPKEAKFQAKIMEYLNSRSDVLAWKDQAGLYQSKGVPDIIAIKDGLFYGFVVKRPFFGKLSSIQSSFHDKIRSAGGRVYVVSLVSEVRNILDTGR